jgi:hypothetical protein
MIALALTYRNTAKVLYIGQQTLLFNQVNNPRLSRAHLVNNSRLSECSFGLVVKRIVSFVPTGLGLVNKSRLVMMRCETRSSPSHHNLLNSK